MTNTLNQISGLSHKRTNACRAMIAKLFWVNGDQNAMFNTYGEANILAERKRSLERR
jgi:hypothetical protein